MKQKLSFLLVLVFLLAVSGTHLFIDNDNCCAESEHSQEGHNDCPCPFHSNGVIEQPTVIDLNLEPECIPCSAVAIPSDVKYCQDIHNLFFFLRSPPQA